MGAHIKFVKMGKMHEAQLDAVYIAYYNISEHQKEVSTMKKLCFKVLCMVLIIALLAPNVFAAAPTPEAPLADAATVERVKQEVADGEITDVKMYSW